MPKHVIVNLKTKDKGLKERNYTLLIWEKQLKWQVYFSSETVKHGRKWQNILQVLQELLTQNSISSENIFQEWRGIQDILRWRKSKRICHQQINPKRMAKESSPNRKKWLKKDSWNIKKEERTQNNKNMGKCNTFSSSCIY